MAITISQSATAVCPRVPASFLAAGGTGPYTYSVETGGAGGTINGATGEYLAPDAYSFMPARRYDTIRATDITSATATARILVGSPLMLVANIVQEYFGLTEDRVRLWDQKIMQPTDAGLWIAVSQMSVVPIGTSNRFNKNTNKSEQFATLSGTVQLDLISRDGSARDRKEELLLAFDTDYSRRQQDANSFSLARLTTSFINLSQIDGAAIPYRYQAMVRITYLYQKARDTSYFDDFTTEGEISTEQSFEITEAAE